LGGLVTMSKESQYYQLGSHVKEIINRTILITGNSRSGTTITGKILGSCRNCEYFFEPELLFSLFAIINQISKKNWKLLFETYVIEDLVIKSAMGRNLNMRPQDESCFLNTKNKKDHKTRLMTNPSRKYAIRHAEKKIPTIKIPDITRFLSKFQKYYPKIKIVICTRNNKSIAKSIKKKKWYSEQKLQNFTWPFYFYKKNQIPFFINKKQAKKWLKMNENEKINENIASNIPSKNIRFFKLNYDNCLKNKAVLFSLIKKLKLRCTQKTFKNIDSFKQIKK